MKDTSFQITSQAFKDGGEIPVQYTCKGPNVSPPISIIGIPQKAKSLALIVHDPDAVSGDYTHWLVWDMPSSTESIAANTVPVGAVQGPNGMGNKKYMGPCPPAGTGVHRYVFELYALNKALSLDANTERQKLEESIKDHVIAKSVLVGKFAAD